MTERKLCSDRKYVSCHCFEKNMLKFLSSSGFFVKGNAKADTCKLINGLICGQRIAGVKLKYYCTKPIAPFALSLQLRRKGFKELINLLRPVIKFQCQLRKDHRSRREVQLVGLRAADEVNLPETTLELLDA